MLKELFEYGEKVDGYSVRVLNEREARAGAGILFAFGLLSLTNSVMLGHIIFTKVFISFFTLDFFIRVLNPSYSPSLLLGRFFIQNQTPEYVGAVQKRFAWGVGFILAFAMFYLLVLNPTITPIKVLICILCLIFLISESAFSICLGCKMYEFFTKKQATNCPGGVCEIRKKEKIQTFNTIQKIIVILTTLFIIIGTYLFITKIEDRTFLSKKIKEMLMTQDELKALEEQEYLKELEEFENDDDF